MQKHTAPMKLSWKKSEQDPSLKIQRTEESDKLHSVQFSYITRMQSPKSSLWESLEDK